MRIACIIPARGGSKGLKDKNIADFNGHPLISYSINQAHASSYIEAVYVTSDSTDILSIASSYGAIGITRPNEISDDYASSESAILHALNNINEEYDAIIFLQCTSPLRTPSDINTAIKIFVENNYDSLFSACELTDSLIWNKNGESLVSANYDYKNRKRRQDHKPEYLENGSIYIFKTKQFLQTKNRLFGKIGMYLMENWKMFEIDNQEDLELCSIVYSEKIYDNRPMGEFIDSYIRYRVKQILDINKFPDYDEIYTDNFSELIDKLCIVHIRYWYLEDAMACAETDEELLRLRKKSESLFKEKRPMLVAGLDKYIHLLAQNKIKSIPENVKHYKGWKQKEL